MHMCTMYVRRGISVSVYGFSSARRSPKLPPSLPFPSPSPLFNLYLYLLSLSVGFRSTLSYEHSLGSIRGRNGVAVHRRAAASLPLFSIVLS